LGHSNEKPFPCHLKQLLYYSISKKSLVSFAMKMTTVGRRNITYLPPNTYFERSIDIYGAPHDACWVWKSQDIITSDIFL
jgi:hypothetical protein